ncbi:VWA domain-containing protein [Mycobacterium sp. 236(2023)]|uniref:nitric oxide reductase activation protein NorD n=1 Tax=Mycobacterium sp. 236(2023) TaxID=3038163 RepID=UPI0024151407|nr:VWA domain-containing protein [Mycobacterium sp. 236(2023)]MDG4668169.1 VWA domain-containing protein [Mycobacterium sp. 236(2023)]
MLPLRRQPARDEPIQQNLREFEILAAVAAGHWLEIGESTGHSHATSTEILVALDTEPERVRDVVLVQAALSGAGALHAAWAAGLRDHGRRSRVAERFLTLEVPRALRARAECLPELAELAATLGPEWPTSSSADESLRRASQREALPDPPAWFGRLAPDLPAREIAETPHRDIHASEIDDGPNPVDAEVNPHAAELAKVLADLAIEIDDNWLLRKLRRSRRGSAGSTASEAAPKARSRVRRRGGEAGALLWTRASTGPERTPMRALTSRRGRENARQYPEFDIDRMAMRADHCTVYDIDATEQQTGAALPQLADPQLRRRLASVILTPAPSRRHSDGDELDLDAAVDARATWAATGQAEDRVWLAPRPRRPDLAVMVLLDLSGSVSSTSAGVSTHRRQIELAEIITDALGGVGARVALHGFRSQDRRNVEMVRIVPFGTPWDARARSRLHACQPCGFTRLGAAIRRAADTIDDDQGANRRLLLVISDGVAYDSGYEGGYAEADSRQALREANSRGIGTLCVTVGADTTEAALGRVFGTAPRVRARVADDLRGPLAAMMRTALQTTHARRGG